jgi:hypothetical protein
MAAEKRHRRKKRNSFLEKIRALAAPQDFLTLLKDAEAEIAPAEFPPSALKWVLLETLMVQNPLWNSKSADLRVLGVRLPSLKAADSWITRQEQVRPNSLLWVHHARGYARREATLKAESGGWMKSQSEVRATT